MYPAISGIGIPILGIASCCCGSIELRAVQFSGMYAVWAGVVMIGLWRVAFRRAWWHSRGRH
jgi:hypothetical protein